MNPQNLFVIIMALCLVNGLISPMLPIVWSLHPVWLPEMVRASNEVIFYGASLIVSTATLLLAAVPAAISERLGMSQRDAMVVWLVGVATLLLLALG